MSDQKLSVMADFADRVKEKVKRDFAGMIPDDAWDKLVENAVQSFIKEDLQKVVKQELEKDIRKRIQDHLQSAEWSQQWDMQGRHHASSEVRRLISENINAIVAAALGTTFQAVVEDIRNRIGNRY